MRRRVSRTWTASTQAQSAVPLSSRLQRISTRWLLSGWSTTGPCRRRYRRQRWPHQRLWMGLLRVRYRRPLTVPQPRLRGAGRLASMRVVRRELPLRAVERTAVRGTQYLLLAMTADPRRALLLVQTHQMSLWPRLAAPQASLSRTLRRKAPSFKSSGVVVPTVSRRGTPSRSCARFPATSGSPTT